MQIDTPHRMAEDAGKMDERSRRPRPFPSRARRLERVAKNWELYLFVLPAVAYFFIFKYWPIYGLQIAFRDFMPSLGVQGSPWVGLKHFLRFITGPQFVKLIQNTLGLSVYALAVGFPAPIILALLMNELGRERFKKAVQTVTYAPNFISMVVMVGMLIQFLSPSAGFVNKIIIALGGKEISFFSRPEWFRSIYILSGVWQRTGWGSIIYLAALAGIDPQLHEAATVDGATRLQRILHINLPGIAPTIVILLILNVGNLMSVGFEKAYLMQNALNLGRSEIISTYVYKVGILGTQFSYTSAVGLFDSVINFILLVSVNTASKRLTETSLW
jgi:putative aldouronate transport system permease protein